MNVFPGHILLYLYIQYDDDPEVPATLAPSSRLRHPTIRYDDHPDVHTQNTVTHFGGPRISTKTSRGMDCTITLSPTRNWRFADTQRNNLMQNLTADNRPYHSVPTMRHSHYPVCDSYIFIPEDQDSSTPSVFHNLYVEDSGRDPQNPHGILIVHHAVPPSCPRAARSTDSVDPTWLSCYPVTPLPRYCSAPALTLQTQRVMLGQQVQNVRFRTLTASQDVDAVSASLFTLVPSTVNLVYLLLVCSIQISDHSYCAPLLGNQISASLVYSNKRRDGKLCVSPGNSSDREPRASGSWHRGFLDLQTALPDKAILRVSEEAARAEITAAIAVR
nr:hypothetical protein CFP56_44480 [Quercus suber]